MLIYRKLASHAIRNHIRPVFRFSGTTPSPPGLNEATQEYLNQMDQKIAAFEQNQPFFDRLLFFDPDVMATLPGPLDRLDPAVEFGKDFLMGIHDYLGIPWVGVLGLACIVVRTTLMPLIYLQMKRTSKLAVVVPAIVQMKRLIDKVHASKFKRMSYFARVTFEIVRKQKLKFYRLFLYNIFHFPILITSIWSIRRLLVQESVQQTSFLWIKSLSAIDPYYILPILTVGCYYFNLQRFITRENKDTIPSRLRSFGQFLLILWLPVLCNWPSAIVIYMFFNALYSLGQTSLMLTPEFQKFVDPKMFLYQIILRIAEYDNRQSKALIETIMSGEETFTDKAVQEEELVEQMKEAIKQLNAEQTQTTKSDNIYNKF